MPIAAVSRHHGVGWHLVMGLLCDWSGLVQDHRRKQSCRVLLIDETSIRKRHRYVTVILNGDTGELLDMIEGRSKAALSRFFIEQGPRWCHSVKAEPQFWGIGASRLLRARPPGCFSATGASVPGAGSLRGGL